ncbi:uncharacterized protein LOC100821404 isoform X3 [Brachypodium distachyon]|uniref:Uncharacterized protein n=1 Tax=Brachypodium distachyon TaxID=15368 RepID=A0A0Q3G970_BRADI|nr:uncharacterized protein LOC100821404 isoform X3 [Brachypodium distachyon]KQK08008.1 hypothetical protein BRADI_2g38974v3 [Brachypodium distachyon]|eukprot:XP_024315145.1 uncharacterized protein LOC100821404 isoform X3 [Brachypodium distachyon]
MLHSWRNLDRVYRSAYEYPWILMARNVMYRSACQYPWILMARNIAAGHPKLRYRHSPYDIDLFCISNHVPVDKHFAITKRKIMREIQVTRMRDYVMPFDAIEGTSHRDGSIYKHFALLKYHRITEPDETPLEPPTCLPGRKRCLVHVLQGSPIEMTCPKRGISFACSVLVEFDMRIKKGTEGVPSAIGCLH